MDDYKRESEGKAKAEGNPVVEIFKLKTPAPPAHYTLKLESFSKLADVLIKTNSEKYESEVFEAEGYKWKLLLYPTGDRKRDGNDHISLYLAMDKTNKLAPGWAVNVVFKFFVYDWIRREYLIVQDGKVRLYHSLETEHGFPRMLPHGMIYDSSYGFLVGDCCAFGAEVYVIKGSSKGEKLSILDNPESGTFTWEIGKLSTLGTESQYSNKFNVGPCAWQLMLYPKEGSSTDGKSLSLYLALQDHNFDQQPRVCADFQLWIKDQVYQKHHKKTVVGRWFDSKNMDCGFPKFIMLSDLQDPWKVFLQYDTLAIEVKFSSISVVQASLGEV